MTNMYDLVITDENYSKIGAWFVKQGDEFMDMVRVYCTLMNSLVEKGFIAGDTSDALKTFISSVETEIQKNSYNPSYIGTASQRFADNFITKIDVADGDLY